MKNKDKKCKHYRHSPLDSHCSKCGELFAFPSTKDIQEKKLSCGCPKNDWLSVCIDQSHLVSLPGRDHFVGVNKMLPEQEEWQKSYAQFIEETCQAGGEEKFISEGYAFYDELKAFISKTIAKEKEKTAKEIFEQINNLKAHKKDWSYWYDADDINTIALNIKKSYLSKEEE